MHHKNILLVSATTRLHERMRELSHVIDVSIALANAASFSQAAASGHTFDLIILDLQVIFLLKIKRLRAQTRQR